MIFSRIAWKQDVGLQSVEKYRWHRYFRKKKFLDPDVIKKRSLWPCRCRLRTVILKITRWQALDEMIECNHHSFKLNNPRQSKWYFGPVWSFINDSVIYPRVPNVRRVEVTQLEWLRLFSTVCGRNTEWMKNYIFYLNLFDMLLFNFSWQKKFSLDAGQRICFSALLFLILVDSLLRCFLSNDRTGCEMKLIIIAVYSLPSGWNFLIQSF